MRVCIEGDFSTVKLLQILHTAMVFSSKLSVSTNLLD